MRLTKISYTEYRGDPQEWVLDEMSFDDRNLLVGKNASGKSRILNVVAGLASQLNGSQLGLSGDYSCEFSSEFGTYLYQISFRELLVTYEHLTIDGVVKMTRNDLGEGQIFTQNLGENGRDLGFQSPPNSLAAVSRRDSIQHPFLEPLHKWAAGLRHFRFGTNLGKDAFSVFIPGGPKIDDRDQSQISGIFRNAERMYGSSFLDPLKADLARVGYSVTNVRLGPPVSLRVHIPQGGPTEVFSLAVTETGMSAVVDQHSMSQGMYRVLSLLIWFNYFQLNGIAACCVIDDIGEGLDFERSCNLIELLREKSVSHNIQLIMSTNDKNVMNGVPLKEWAILVRTGSRVHVRNYENSKEVFDQFRFTGLSNFSFFELDVINTPTSEKVGTPSSAGKA
jgi:energy-coupling factor transporter ATP-binding protein EcfA2